MRTTIKEVAKLANVSITTVSNVLNGNYKNMSEETRKRVEQVMDELNYYPGIGARSLPRKGRSKTVCIVIPHTVDYTFNHPYFAGVMKGIAAVLEDKGYRAMILNTRDKKKSELNYLKGLRQGVADGFLFFDIDKNDPYVHEFMGSSIPFMVVGRYDEGKGYYVDIDVEGGAYMATRHLIFHGHRKIALLAGPKSMIFTQQIIAGYKRALKENGVRYLSSKVYFGEFSADYGYQATLELLNTSDRPTAVFSTSVQTTFGLIRALTEKGLCFPEDLAFISFGEDRSFGLFNKSISYIKQPEFEIGRTVMERLMDQIETPKPPTDPEILPVKLVLGTSCGCPE